MSALDMFEKMLSAGNDSVLLRYSLGNEYLKAGRAADAVAHLRAAIRLDPHYSAGWKLLGKALAETGASEDALAVYRQGITVAEQRGDLQAAKEMTVFARRLERLLNDPPLADG